MKRHPRIDRPHAPVRSRFPGIPLLLAGVTACAPADDAQHAAFTVRDSAGVRIVESSRPLWSAAERWRLSGAPLVEIGVADGAPEYSLSRVSSGFRTARGEIVLENQGSQEIRVYDDSGRYLHSLGRQGEGPGEFQRLAWISRLPRDSVVAYDQGQGRLTVFSPEGELVRTLVLTGDGYPPRATAVFPDGSILVIGYPDLAEPDYSSGAVTREQELYLRISPDGVSVDTIALQPGSERAYELSVIPGRGTGVRTTAPLFAREQIHAVADGRLLLGSNDAYEIAVHTPDGRLESLIRRARPPRPITDADLDLAVSTLLADLTEPEQRRRVQRRRELVAAGAYMPHYNRFLGDDAGNLWVQEYDPNDVDPDLWSVFDDTGRLLGTVELPDRFRPLHIGDDFVLGVARDDLDVERARLYELEKG